MKASFKAVTCGATALFAALCLQAQSTQQREPQPSSSPSTNSPSLQGQQPSTPPPATPQDRRNEQWRSQAQPGTDTTSQRQFDPKSSATPDPNRSRNSADQRNQQSSTQSQYQTQQQTTVTAETDTQVTTVVQQIDSQGPVVVERVSTQFADVACTPENARMIFEALHSGNEVTLNIEGQTTTFRPTGRLGYGEAYIAMSLAVEALRNAGITGCATPDQWRAVFLGGQLSGGTSRSTTVTTTHFPGILTLKTQGQGWGQVAQTTNVQLGQVVNRANTSLKINSNSNQDSWRQQQNQSDQQKRQNQPGQQYQQDQKQKDQKEKDQQQRDARSNQPRTSGPEQQQYPGQQQGQSKDRERDQTTPRSDSNPSSSQPRSSDRKY